MKWGISSVFCSEIEVFSSENHYFDHSRAQDLFEGGDETRSKKFFQLLTTK